MYGIQYNDNISFVQSRLNDIRQNLSYLDLEEANRPGEISELFGEELLMLFVLLALSAMDSDVVSRLIRLDDELTLLQN